MKPKPSHLSGKGLSRLARRTSRSARVATRIAVASIVLFTLPGLTPSGAIDLQSVIGPQTEAIRRETLGESGEFEPSRVLRSVPPVVEGTYAFDLQMMVSQQTRLIRHEATEYQRKVAEARARAYVAQLRSKAAAAGPSKSEKKNSTEPGKTAATHGKKGSATPSPADQKKEPQSKPVATSAIVPRFIAVETIKDKASPPGTTPVMVWDTRSEKLVNNSIYDVSNPPAIGSTEKFDTYSAQYIGPGVANR